MIKKFTHDGREYTASFYNLFRAGVVAGVQITSLIASDPNDVDEVSEEVLEIAKTILLEQEKNKTIQDYADLTGVYIPPGAVDFSLRKNEHKADGSLLVKFLFDADPLFLWQSQELKLQALHTDEFWVMRFRGNGGWLFVLAAPTLDDLNRFAREIDLREKAKQNEEPND